MAYFSNADDVYATIGQLMQDTASSRGLGSQLRQVSGSVQLALSNPTATITITFSEGQDAAVAVGSPNPNPTLALEMDADTAHEIFLGNLSFFEAARDGRVKQKGAIPSLSVVLLAAEFALPSRYAQLLAASGRGDLAASS